jgi:hypothetical protein
MGWLRARTVQPEEPRARELSLVDVSDRHTGFDPSVLELIATAPVWMTRAERLLLFTLAFTLRPARYLEVGTLKGGSALLVNAAMEALGGDGRLVCLDPNPQISDDHWAQLRRRATLVRGLSPDALPEAKHLAGGPFDLILIDGDHTAAGVLRDATGVLSVAASGAHVLFHDAFNADVGSGIDEFVRGHAGRVCDVGPLTREITTERAPDGSRVVWGGLRLIALR